MNPVTVKLGPQVIVYDADTLTAVEPAWFDPEHWRGIDALLGAAPGRGTTHFVASPVGELVLRRYLRGGWAARLSRESYFFSQASRSRPMLEFDLLQRMEGAGLRVPKPLAALCERRGLAYRGALITHRIAPARALAERLDDPLLDWEALGRDLRGFHDAGVDHADLNARNILLHDDTGRAWLLDFDRSSFTPGQPVDGRRNLARLRRSLVKLWPEGDARLDDCWAALLQGHREGFSS
jgi:3-deoxy-D-manno-octulosonic acid kinase